MSAVDDYFERGGAIGISEEILKKELEHAFKDEMHVLRKTALALEEGNMIAVEENLKEALLSAMDDPVSKLNYPALFLLKLPLFQAAVQFVKDNYDDHEKFEDFPAQIIKMGAFEYAYNAKASSAGKKKGANTRERIIAIWESEPDKKNVSAFARKLFKRLGGKYDEEGNRATKEIPSERTIARTVSEYEKRKKNAVF